LGTLHNFKLLEIDMKNYILVHGAWGGAWEFDDVVNLLTKTGNKATAVDLPGHGKNQVPLAEITMQAYVNTLLNVIKKQDERVILVGHSLAGAVIARVSELAPELIERLIFVAAVLPKNKQSALELMQNDEHGLLPHVVFSEDQTYATVQDETVRTRFLNDVTDQKRLDKLVPDFLFAQATEPFMATAQLSPERFGQVRKFYIRATVDKVLSPALQSEMLNSWEMEKVYNLKSGHFPLTSIPEELVEVLIDASN
jgi:pimeloyl-ACP methyl ester carboxylesterase